MGKWPDKEWHNRITIHQTDQGMWYIVDERMKSKSLVRKEYYPIGNSLIYPSKLESNWAKRKLVEHHIQEDIRVIQMYEEHMKGMQLLLSQLGDVE
jgi:adenosyl cobinamide kinase/adenosyl cobinamide phosphate guanylyltransferase